MQIIRSKRKTVALIIERDGNLTVRAPLNIDPTEIESLVAQKSGWIRERQEWIRSNLPPPHRYQAGEHFFFLGLKYPLQIVEHQKVPLVLDQAFKIDLKAYPDARVIFKEWYKKHARKFIGERATALSARHNLKYNRLRITSARTRWGSCSTRKTLSFTWRLVMAPPEVIDYVVIHELAHLKHHRHTSEFWKLVEQLCPEYRARRGWLKENGFQLDLE